MLSVGAIALVVGILLGRFDTISEMFNIDSSLIAAFQDFIEQYIKGIPIPPPIS